MSDKQIKTSVSPVTDWMHKRDLPGVMRIEDSNHEYEGWSEKDFLRRLREKNVIGMVSKVVDVVSAYVVYELREKEIFLLRFEVAKELKTTRAAHVLLEELKRKALKFKKNVVGAFWEGESIDTFKFFANEGFKSKVKKNFFLETHPFSPDAIEFMWDCNENARFNTDVEGKVK